MISKNDILQIIEENFLQELEQSVEESISNLESEDLESIFEQLVDYAELDTIDEVAIDDVEQEEDDIGVTIEGVMDIRVSLNGFSYWDGEYNYIEDAEYVLGFAFSFYAEGTEYSDFDMEHIY